MTSSRFEQTLARIRAEYVEMPGLVLLARQLERLCGVEPALCQLALDSLVRTKFLRKRTDGCYIRAQE